MISVSQPPGARLVAPGTYECVRCGYQWRPRPPDHIPARCPSCSMSLRRPIFPRVFRCLSCGYEWPTRKRAGGPLKCPKCFRRIARGKG